MKKTALIRLSITLMVGFSTVSNSLGQQPGALVSTAPTQSAAAPGQTQQPSPPLLPYYDYSYGSKTTSDRKLSVEQAVTLALDNAASLRQAQFDEESAREDVKQGRSAMLPQFNMPLTYWGTTPSQVRQPGDPLIASFVAASAINESIGWLNTTGTIDIAGKLRAELNRSRALLTAAHAGTMTARRNLVLATIDAYYNLALTRERRNLADEALALAEGFLSSLEDQQKSGAPVEVDVLRARSAARSRRDELAQAQFAESLAMSQLRVLTGVDYSVHINVPRLSAGELQVTGIPAYQEDSIMSRPELAQLDAQKHAALLDARAARRELWPQLTYTLSAGFDAANFKPLGRYSGGSALITLNIPIFNFGASKSRATQAELRAQSLDVQRNNQVLQLKQEFYAARAGALSALDRTKFAAQAAGAAQRNLSLIFDRYRSNKATLLEILDAQADYSATRLEYYQAIIDYHSARARLELDPTEMFGRPAGPVIQPETKVSAPCTLGRDQAPRLDRIYLGMTEAQIKQVVPGLQIGPANELGVSDAEVKAADILALAGSSPAFEGVESIALKFTDGRLSYVRVAYPQTNRWGGKFEFVSALTSKLSVKGEWKPFYDWRNKEVRDAEDLTDMAVECEGFRLAGGLGLEAVGGEQTPHFDLDDLTAASIVKQREDEKRRKEPPKK